MTSSRVWGACAPGKRTKQVHFCVTTQNSAVFYCVCCSYVRQRYGLNWPFYIYIYISGQTISTHIHSHTHTSKPLGVVITKAMVSNDAQKRESNEPCLAFAFLLHLLHRLAQLCSICVSTKTRQTMGDLWPETGRLYGSVFSLIVLAH